MISTQDGEKSDTTGQKFVARACSHQGGPLLKSHVFDLLNWTIKQAPATSPTSTNPPHPPQSNHPGQRHVAELVARMHFPPVKKIKIKITPTLLTVAVHRPPELAPERRSSARPSIRQETSCLSAKQPDSSSGNRLTR